MRRLDTRRAWPVRIHEAHLLAIEWGGRMGTRLVSEEDIAFAFEFVVKELLEVVTAEGETRVYAPGVTFGMQINIHVEGDAPIRPEVAERFTRRGGG